MIAPWAAAGCPHPADAAAAMQDAVRIGVFDAVVKRL
jgi:hypothetical protein